MGSIKNFGRFYAILRTQPEIDKDEIVLQFTGGRTTHLREMRADEYIGMCNALDGSRQETLPSDDRELRRARSAALLRIGRLGISTVDNWAGIDAFCLSPKIAGKKFAAMDVAELKSLVRKLENIIARGGLKWVREEESRRVEAMAMAIGSQTKIVS
jgi:hypothetical protein